MVFTIHCLESSIIIDGFFLLFFVINLSPYQHLAIMINIARSCSFSAGQMTKFCESNFWKTELYAEGHAFGLEWTITLSTCPVWVGRKSTGFLHHNQSFDVTIEKSDYDIKNLILMQTAHGFWDHLNWKCGQRTWKACCYSGFLALELHSHKSMSLSGDLILTDAISWFFHFCSTAMRNPRR